MTVCSSSEWHQLATRILVEAGASPANAACVADALIAAEIDGISSHGLSRVPAYAYQLASGKIEGLAVPQVIRAASAVMSVDARHGFAFPAIAAGIEAALPARQPDRFGFNSKERYFAVAFRAQKVTRTTVAGRSIPAR